MRMRGTDMFRGGDTGLFAIVDIISSLAPPALVPAGGIIATFRFRLWRRRSVRQYVLRSPRGNSRYMTKTTSSQERS
jgi:hypothetical protein